jgi:hypothetical protein
MWLCNEPFFSLGVLCYKRLMTGLPQCSDDDDDGRRRDEVVKRMLATPPQPRKAKKKAKS